MAWPGQKLTPKDCALCGSPFSVTNKDQRFCSRSCARAGGARRISKLTPDLLKEGDLLAPKGGKLAYIANKAECTQKTVCDYAKSIGFKFSPRLRVATRTGSPEQDYAKRTGCVICPEKRATEAAHIVPRKEGGSGRIPNIIPLCPTHHRCYDRDLLTPDEFDVLRAFIKRKLTAAAA